MKKFLGEFKAFIDRGNVMDLAVAVVIGAAFTAIVNSIVSDLIMPLISLLTGGVSFEDMKLSVGVGDNAAAFAYGNFINAVIQFLIISLVVFFIVKMVNRTHTLTERRGAEEEKKAPHCPYCLETVAEGATRCPHCTSELPVSPEPSLDR